MIARFTDEERIELSAAVEEYLHAIDGWDEPEEEKARARRVIAAAEEKVRALTGEERPERDSSRNPLRCEYCGKDLRDDLYGGLLRWWPKGNRVMPQGAYVGLVEVLCAGECHHKSEALHGRNEQDVALYAYAGAEARPHGDWMASQFCLSVEAGKKLARIVDALAELPEMGPPPPIEVSQ